MDLDKTRAWLLIVVSGLLLVLPPVALALDEPFYLTVVGRIMIFAIAALSLESHVRKLEQEGRVARNAQGLVARC